MSPRIPCRRTSRRRAGGEPADDTWSPSNHLFWIRPWGSEHRNTPAGFAITAGGQTYRSGQATRFSYDEISTQVPKDYQGNFVIERTGYYTNTIPAGVVGSLNLIEMMPRSSSARTAAGSPSASRRRTGAIRSGRPPCASQAGQPARPPFTFGEASDFGSPSGGKEAASLVNNFAFGIDFTDVLKTVYYAWGPMPTYIEVALEGALEYALDVKYASDSLGPVQLSCEDLMEISFIPSIEGGAGLKGLASGGIRGTGNVIISMPVPVVTNEILEPPMPTSAWRGASRGLREHGSCL